MKRFGRRPPRLTRIHQAVDAPVWFVTFCTHRRQKWLVSDAVHAAFVHFAERAAEDFNVAVGQYIIMPDHVHLFVCGNPQFVLVTWIGALKQALAKAAHRSKSDGQIWQEGFFDHVLRNDESMSQKWDYIRDNALRAGLVGASRRLALPRRDHPHRSRVNVATALWAVCLSLFASTAHSAVATTNPQSVRRPTGPWLQHQRTGRPTRIPECEPKR